MANTKRKDQLIGKIVTARAVGIANGVMLLEDEDGNKIRVYPYDADDDSPFADLTLKYEKGRQYEVFINRLSGNGRHYYGSTILAANDLWNQRPFPYKTDDIVTGLIVRVFEFGAIAMIKGGIQGFIDSSDVTSSAYQAASNLFYVGDEVKGMITEINRDRFQVGICISRYNERRVYLDKLIRSEGITTLKDAVTNKHISM
ncbi:MAG: S1 RNA-binding domain-containing protein [Nitrospirae bacterium]|nr:S1 RNA-binding domain-containing protein [Nitrospirota bacterium]